MAEENYNPNTETKEQEAAKPAHDGNHRHTGAERLKRYAESLLEQANKENSDELFAKYYMTMVEYCMASEDYIKLEIFASEGIRCMERAGLHDYVIKTNLILARYADKLGNLQREIILLLTALEDSRTYDYFEEAVIAARRLGTLFFRVEEFNRSTYYFKIALSMFEKTKGFSEDADEYPELLSKIGRALLFSGRGGEAEKIRKTLLDYDKRIEDDKQDYKNFVIYSFLAAYAFKTGDVDGLTENIEKIESSEAVFDNYTECLDDIMGALLILQEAGRYSECVEMLDMVIDRCRRDQAPYSISSIFYGTRLNMAMMMGETSQINPLITELFKARAVENKGTKELFTSAERGFHEQRRLRAAQEAVLHSNEELKEGIRKVSNESAAKSAFISSMSHELRTPINAMLGLDEMILRESTDETIRNYAFDIRRAGKALLGIIGDILDFSKIEAGKMTIIPEEYDTAALVKDTIELVVERAEKKGLELKYEVNPDIPRRLFGDDMRIKQIITNLLTNAVKYTEEGSVIFRMDYEVANDKEVELYVLVKDTGIGMKIDEMDKLFSPFERLDVNKNRTVEGTGLGMSIVTSLLTQMGSAIKVNSIYGEGSEFSFVLKQEVRDREPVGAVNLDERLSDDELENKALFEAHRAKVLVVDDTQMNLLVVKGMLKRTGVQLETAESGYECVEKCQQTHYDIILLDHRMPGMDGVETLHEIKRLGEPNEKTPVIVLTANVVSGAEEYYIKEGFVGFLAKPMSGLQLETTILKHIDRSLLDTDEDKLLVLDEDAGVKACGTKEIFLSGVKDFVANASAKQKELRSYLEQRDMKTYTVKVHALKSESRLVGATGLSAEAAYLEKCGNEGKYEEIDAKAEGLLEHLQKVTGLLAQKYGLEQKEEQKPVINPTDFVSMLEAMLEFSKNFDFDKVDEVMQEINGFDLTEEFYELQEKLQSAVYNYDAEEIEKIARICIDRC